jgi:hypothetical protein
MNYERVKQDHGISITLFRKGNQYFVRAYNFLTSEVIYKRPFDNAKGALNHYEDIYIDKSEPKGLAGRYDYLTMTLNA